MPCLREKRYLQNPSFWALMNNLLANTLGWVHPTDTANRKSLLVREDNTLHEPSSCSQRCVSNEVVFQRNPHADLNEPPAAAKPGGASVAICGSLRTNCNGSGARRERSWYCPNRLMCDIEELINAIDQYVDRHNEAPKPFIWTASANDILEKVKRARAALLKGQSA